MQMNLLALPTDLDLVLHDPAAYFAEPKDVLPQPGMTAEFKQKLLRAWEREVRLRNGTAAQATLLLVRHALLELEASMTVKESVSVGDTIRAVAGGIEEAATQVQNAAAHTRDGISEFRRFMRAQPITGAVLMVGLGWILGRITHPRS